MLEKILQHSSTSTDPNHNQEPHWQPDLIVWLPFLFMQTKDSVLVKALLILSEDIYSEDGVANACILEAALRLKELSEGIHEVLMENLHLADGEDCTLLKLKKLINFTHPEKE